jgi:hypothetical protein
MVRPRGPLFQNDRAGPAGQNPLFGKKKDVDKALAYFEAPPLRHHVTLVIKTVIKMTSFI